MSNFEELKQHIIGLSISNNFNEARIEWVVSGFTLDDDWDRCPCGKKIKELCHLKNVRNNNFTHVGNVCVNKFLELETGNLFSGLRRIVNDADAAPNRDLIDHAESSGYIFPREVTFLRQTLKKRNLSHKQLAWRQKINRRIIQQTVVRR